MSERFAGRSANGHGRSAALQRRYTREKKFIFLAIMCLASALLFLGGLLTDVALQGWRGFLHSSVQLEVLIEPSVVGTNGEKSSLVYQRLIKKALLERFPPASGDRADKKQVQSLISLGGGRMLRTMVQKSPRALLGRRVTMWLPAAAVADSYFKGSASAEQLLQARIGAAQIARLDELRAAGHVRVSFNTGFFTAADSRNPELAGLGAALRGSFYTLLLTFLFSFPVGLLAAMYLELFAPRNRWFDFLEININNLAAVPSIIFGLLGLAVFINIFGLPRSSPLVGGLVLSLMTLPTIIIVSRAALRGVPPSLLAGALSLGATRMQGVFHHVVPAAMPGILTGTIIGMAQALGETAPLLLIGMVAFIAEVPRGVSEAATALPVQIFLWADSPERGFAERTATAIIVLLGFLMAMNAAAIILRRRLEIKW